MEGNVVQLILLINNRNLAKKIDKNGKNILLNIYHYNIYNKILKKDILIL